ncbi:DUF5615 family PIN-like protein [bacterium SCSIO 12827]|nr:DUF5615 family PIN-like protein [bacterium SCSIO 12827]
MRFFIDNNLPPQFARALDALSHAEGHSVQHLRDLFPSDTPDHVWLNVLADEGNWIIITQDRIRKNDLEKMALRRTGIVTFMLKKSWSDHKFWEKAQNLVKWWPRIMEHAEGVTNGVFLVDWRMSGKGKFETVTV